MTIDPTSWQRVRRLFCRAFASSYQYAVATIDADGSPRVTPIGSLVLHDDGRGFFFEVFARGLGADLDRDPRMSILAVDTSATVWLRAFLIGRFAEPPAVRLRARTVGPPRASTEDERRLFLSRVAPLRFTRGHRRLWGRLDRVRDVAIDSIDPVGLGPMTRGLWR